MANPKCLSADDSVSTMAKNKQTQPHFYLSYFQNIVFDFFCPSQAGIGFSEVLSNPSHSKHL